MHRNFSSLLPKALALGVKSTFALWAWVFGAGVSAAGIALVYGGGADDLRDVGSYSLGFVQDLERPQEFIAYVNRSVVATATRPQPKLLALSLAELDEALQTAVVLSRSSPALLPSQVSASVLKTLKGMLTERAC
jgi:hypothetical protein